MEQRPHPSDRNLPRRARIRLGCCWICWGLRIGEQGAFSLIAVYGMISKGGDTIMKSLELEPTKENILETLKNNILDRNKDVWYLARLCDAQEGKCSIALDAKWGNGKTFFVKQTKLLIEAMNSSFNTLSDEDQALIKGAFSPYLHRKKETTEFLPQVCVYYDAWSNDNDNDPILSLIFEIVRSSTVDYDFKGDIDYIKILTNLVDVCTGRNVTAFFQPVKSKDPLKKLKEQKEIHIMVEEFLNNLLLDRGKRLVIFIDELDRCKPSYAVQLLERIKHYFTNDRITFVFSVNIEELQHTIRRYYGEGFDACRYLDRFFDYRVSLPPTDMTQYYQEIGLRHTSHLYEATCKTVMDYYSFGLREMKKYYRMARVAAAKPAHNEQILRFADENGLQLLFCAVIPIMIGLTMVDTKRYYDFINGNYSTPLIEIISMNSHLSTAFTQYLFTPSELKNEPSEILTNKLQQMYKAIFIDEGSNEITIGKMFITRQTKDKLMRATSMLSQYASYE